MQKNLLIILIAVEIIGAGVFAFLSINKPNPAPSGNDGQATSTACNYNDPEKSYLKKDKNCVVNFLCTSGKQAFSDECGCGCRPSGNQAKTLDYINKEYDFSFSFPERDALNPNLGYQYVTNNSLARVDLSASDFRGTNLGEASFIIGASGEKTALDACLKNAPEEGATSSEKVINGITMKEFSGEGVGAGNIYNTKSYRVVKNNICYEATLLLHSGRIENYDPPVKEYDHVKALNALTEILDTLKIGDNPKNIIVSDPKPGDKAGLPLEIKGEARAFENTFAYRIKDGDGLILLERSAMASAPDAGFYGAFDLSVNYPEPKAASGTVEVFEYSAKDGAEINKTIIPVSFEKTNSTKVNIFYPNTKKDPNMLDCAKVFLVERRIAKTESVARAAIEELLLGPDRVEAGLGYNTTINPGVKINKLTIQSGIAKIDFDKALEAGVAGSCRVISIRSEIEETLKQFSAVKSVIISIDGRTKDILQP